MSVKTLFTISSLALVLIVCVFAVGCAVYNAEVHTYADNFHANLEKEADAYNSFSLAYNSADFETKYGRSVFQKTLSEHLQTFNSFLDFYESTCPSAAPQDLKDAVDLAAEGTAKIIDGITAMDYALTRLSNYQLSSGEDLCREGANLLNQAIAKYNTFAK